MTKTIVITSGRDGVGKTHISLNTALEISRQNFRTCLFDTDLGLTNANTLLGLQANNNLNDFISGEKKLDEIILNSNRGFDILPGSSDIEKMVRLSKKKISEFISSFSQLENYDYLIIDTSSGISRSLLAFCLAATQTVLVITSEATSLTEAYALLKVLSLNGYRGTVKILVNKCPSFPVSKRTYLRFEAVVNKRLNIKIALAGSILNDPNMETANREQTPLLTLSPNSIASQCIRAMVSTLQESDAWEESRTDFNEFWQHYFDLFQSDVLLTAILPGNDAREPPLPSIDHQPVSFYSPTGADTESLLQKPIVPFPDSGGIINPLKLASPITLLSKSFKLQARGELSKDALLKIFSSDPALMVRALQMFCSSGTSGSNRITRISQIFQKLGTEVLANLVVAASMQRGLTDQVIPDNRFVNVFWHHSYKSALLAEQIAEATGYPYPEEAFLAGLIHDIGRLALQTEYPQVYAQFLHNLQDRETLLEIERHIFQRSHAEIGAEALRAYRLNSFTVDAAQYHTESESKIRTGFELVKIVFIASQMAQCSQENMQQVYALGASLFSLAPDQLLAGIKTATEKSAQIADHFHIPRIEETGNDSTGRTEADLRLQAVNYSILQSALPGPASVRELPQIIRLIHQGLDILFGIKRSFCFMTDSPKTSLQAVGYPNCFGWEILSDIVISLKSENNLIVQSFNAPELKISTDGGTGYPLSLADEQIIGLLDSQVLVCIPMITQEITRGVIVFGIKKEELQNIQDRQERLQQFGARSAHIIFSSEQFLKRKEMQ